MKQSKRVKAEGKQGRISRGRARVAVPYVRERYLYVGNYICGEECVAELGNRSGLPNAH